MVVNRFYRILLSVLIISFILVVPGIIDVARTQTIASQSSSGLTLLLGFSFCLLIALLISKCFRWINTLCDKSCFIFSIVAILLMIGIMVIVSCSARVSQFVDAYDDLDAAIYLRDHLELSDQLPYIRLVGSFGNNYPFILFETLILKILQSMNIEDSIIVLTRLNVIILIAAVILSWLIVKETRGIKAAAKSTIIFLLNPYFYLLVNWTYTMTYSLPLMMGIIYVALRLKNTTSLAYGVILALIEGLLLGAGMLIRVTTIFPMIAVIMIGIPSFFRLRISKRRIIHILCILFTIVLVISITNIQIDRYFGNIKEMKLPYSFWLLMGSHGDGTWNGSDFDTVLSIEDPDERIRYTFDHTIRNYKDEGFIGVIHLLYKKINEAWSNGGFFYWQPSVSEGNSISEYILGSGAKNELTKIYCQAFRLFMIIAFILSCVLCLLKREAPVITMIMMVTVLGCVVFHSIWETNGRYSIPFILPMLITDEYGITEIQAYLDDRVIISKRKRQALGITSLGLLFAACISLNLLMNEKTDLKLYRISSTRQDRFIVPIEPQQFLYLEQDFYTGKVFNTLNFSATIPSDTMNEDCSDYELTILDDQREKLFSTTISPNLINRNSIQIFFDDISGSKHYYICLSKLDKQKGSIRFYTHDTYGVDTYRGNLVVDNTLVSNDIKVDVIYEIHSTNLFSTRMRIIILLLIMTQTSHKKLTS